MRTCGAIFFTSASIRASISLAGIVRCRRACRPSLVVSTICMGGQKPFRINLVAPGIGRRNWCGRRDSNPHILRYWYLKPARLPIPPRPQPERSRAGGAGPPANRGAPLQRAGGKGQARGTRAPRPMALMTADDERNSSWPPLPKSSPIPGPDTIEPQTPARNRNPRRRPSRRPDRGSRTRFERRSTDTGPNPSQTADWKCRPPPD